MPYLGSHVVYHCAESHKTKTVKAEHGSKPVELDGSIHHPELTDFAGLVTREHDTAKGEAETFDIVIFPPGRAPSHIEGVVEGDEPGEIEIVED